MQGNNNLFVVAGKDHLAVFNSFDSDLVNLATDLQTELLAFEHRFTVDDGEMSRGIDRDGADQEGGWGHFTLRVSGTADSGFRFEPDWPKRITCSSLGFERRFVFDGNL